MAEHIFSDFSGGMNALTAVDKLDPKECLLAENVRLDETGNIESAGALTAQNTSGYGGNVHSLFWNPSLGAVAGVGTSIFSGPTLGGMSNALAGKNANSKKMSFGSAYNRVYFDIGNVGYWTDENLLLTVDWPPPVAVGATITGPTAEGTSTQAGSGYIWSNPGNFASTSSNSFASVVLTAPQFPSRNLQATMSTNSFAISTVAVTGVGISCIAMSTSTTPTPLTLNASLIVGGSPVGAVVPLIPNSPYAPGIFQTYTGGGSTYLWGLSSISQASVNAGNFGWQVYAINGNTLATGPDTVEVFAPTMTIYQGAGFTAGTGASGNITDTCSYKITFVDAIGEESDASNDSNQIVLSSQQGTLTGIQLGDGRTVARNIYRIGGILTSHYLVGTIQDNVSTTYSDNQTSAAALAQGTILSGDVPGDYPNTRFNNALIGAIGAPGGMGRFPTLHYDRVFWINPNKPNQIYWSKPLNGFAYPSINQINVGDGKPISRHVSIFGELIIIKTDSIWRLTGTDETSFNLTQTPSAVGTDLPFTVVALPDKILFMNRYGLWVFNGYTAVPLTTKLDMWFKQDDRTGEELYGVNGFHPPEVANLGVAQNNEAVGNAEKYVLAYAETGQSQNSAILIFDVKHGNITKRDGPGIVPLSLAIDPVTGFVYMGDNNGFVSLLDDWNGATAEGSPVNFDFQHGYQNLQRGSNQSLWAIEFFLDTDGQNLTPYVYYDNGNANEALAPISTTSLQRVVRTVQSPTARKMQNFSWRLNGQINPINVKGSPKIQVVHVKALYDVRVGRARTGQ